MRCSQSIVRLEGRKCTGRSEASRVSFPFGAIFWSQGGDADGRPTRGRTKFAAGYFSGRNGRAISWRVDQGNAGLEAAARAIPPGLRNWSTTCTTPSAAVPTWSWPG